MSDNVDGKQIVAEQIWQAYLGGAVGKRVDVSLHTALRDGIPDKYLLIDGIVSFSEAEEICVRFQPYLAEHGVFPILGTLGGNAIGLGTSEGNRGEVYYYDFDFGLFELNRSLAAFMADLIDPS